MLCFPSPINVSWVGKKRLRNLELFYSFVVGFFLNVFFYSFFFLILELRFDLCGEILSIISLNLLERYEAY